MTYPSHLLLVVSFEYRGTYFNSKSSLVCLTYIFHLFLLVEVLNENVTK